MRAWKLERMCDNCPFADEGAGLQLRLSLHAVRWKEITDGLLQGQHFLCHKTTLMDDDANAERDARKEGRYYPHGKICAGARAWQAARGIVSDAEQIMTRMETLQSTKRRQTQ